MSICAVLWSGTILFGFTEPPSPYQSYGVDYVEPTKIHAGDVIGIYRTFKIIRPETVNITRAMVRGDCTKTCEILDLPSGSLTLEPGDYKDVRRDHIIPANITPGIWTLRFTVQWDSRLGIQQSMKLPLLQIEVAPPLVPTAT